MNKKLSLEERMKAVRTVDEFNALEPDTGFSIAVDEEGHATVKISVQRLILPICPLLAVCIS